jgi:hypothetical protein
VTKGGTSHRPFQEYLTREGHEKVATMAQDGEAAAAKKKRFVSHAPEPPHVVLGSSGAPRSNQTVVPPTPPYPYPRSLKAKTDAILFRAVHDTFSNRDQLPELCKHVVANLMPHFSEVLRAGEVRQDEALDRMRDLIHSILVYNRVYESHAREINQELESSREWLALVDMIDNPEAVDAPAPAIPSVGNGTLEMGRWADELLPEIKRFSRGLWAGDKLETLRPEFEPLFTEVFDKLSEKRRERIFEDATGRKLTNVDLAEILAEVKQIKGPTLLDHRKDYRASLRK